MWKWPCKFAEKVYAMQVNNYLATITVQTGKASFPALAEYLRLPMLCKILGPTLRCCVPKSHQLLSSSTCRCLRCLSKRHRRNSSSRSSSCAQCSSHSGERLTYTVPVLRLADHLCHESAKRGRCGNLGATAAACCLAGRFQSCTRRAQAKSEAGASTLVSYGTQPAARCAATTVACQHVGVGEQNLFASHR